MSFEAQLLILSSGRLGLWLRGETPNQMVVLLNPSAAYWMDIFHISLL